MTLTAELRGILPLRPVSLLTHPADLLTAHRLTESLRRDGIAHGVPRRARRTYSDLLVFYLEGDTVPSVVVKHPRSRRATASLMQECEAVRRLEGDERLGSWRRLLPVVERCHLEEPLPLVVEHRLPGTESDTLVRRRPQLAHQVGVSALRAIQEFHRATGHTEEVTARIGDWIDPRLSVLGSQIPWCRHGPGATAMTALREYLVRALTGRSLLVAWTHGDFHPGNVLLSPRHAAPSGVIDWAGAISDGPSAVDCHTFVLTLRRQREGRQFGQVITDVVKRGCLLPEDRRLLADAGVPATDRRGEVALALLTWLWHAAGNAAKSVRYGRSRRWIADNVVPVLSEVVASGAP